MEYFKYANVQSPIDGYDGYSSLSILDPVLYHMLGYYSATITHHIKNAWNYYTTILGKTELYDRPVAYNLPYDPLPFEQTTMFKFPLLAIYRQSNQYNYKAFQYDHIISKFNLIYVMPPLDAAASEILYPFLTHVCRVIQDKTETNSDPSYLNDTNIWERTGLEEIKVLSSDFGKIPNINSNMYFPALSVEIEAMERYNAVSLNYSAFDSVTTSISIKQDGETELNLISIEQSVLEGD